MLKIVKKVRVKKNRVKKYGIVHNIIKANESLRQFNFNIDIDKSSDLKKLKEREEDRKSRLDILNRRMSVSSPDLDAVF